jgi:hypothetical protein
LIPRGASDALGNAGDNLLSQPAGLWLMGYLDSQAEAIGAAADHAATSVTEGEQLLLNKETMEIHHYGTGPRWHSKQTDHLTMTTNPNAANIRMLQ